jgi:hypothetical protein
MKINDVLFLISERKVDKVKDRLLEEICNREEVIISELNFEKDQIKITQLKNKYLIINNLINDILINYKFYNRKLDLLKEEDESIYYWATKIRDKLQVDEKIMMLNNILNI